MDTEGLTDSGFQLSSRWFKLVASRMYPKIELTSHCGVLGRLPSIQSMPVRGRVEVWRLNPIVIPHVIWVTRTLLFFIRNDHWSASVSSTLPGTSSQANGEGELSVKFNQELLRPLRSASRNRSVNIPPYRGGAPCLCKYEYL